MFLDVCGVVMLFGITSLLAYAGPLKRTNGEQDGSETEDIIDPRLTDTEQVINALARNNSNLY